MSPRKKKTLIILLCILVFFGVVRLILPYVILHYANKTLANMKGYYGHIRTIDLSLWRGAYKIDSIYLNKVDSGSERQTEFFSAKLIDLSIEWKALFHGAINGKLTFQDPVLKFTKDKVEPKTLRKDSSSFKNLLNGFMPLDINKFEVNRGRLQYIDQTSKPKVDISMVNTHILALNLRNSYDSAVLLPASVTATADVYGGTLSFNMHLNPLASDPTLDLNAELKDTKLTELNDFFQAYAKVDVNKGTFGLYTEVAARDGKFKGYVKPIIHDLDVLGKEDRHDNILRKLWEGFVGTVADVFSNQKKDQFATKIPFEGSVKDPRSNIWYTISHVLQNAFIRAIVPSIDNQISIASVNEKTGEKKTFLQKIFGKKDSRKKNKDAEKKKK